MKAVVLLSGGIDSAVTLAIAKNKKYEIYALTIDYGQKHKREINCAKKIASFFKVKEHKIIKIELDKFGGSSLTSNIPVPKRKSIENIKKIPSTYVPARNTIFLSLALAYAEVIGAADIFIGANAIDYSGYPDCRPKYMKIFEKLANIATKAGVEKKIKFRIHAPLIYFPKGEIIKKGIKLGVDFSLTHSCYNPTPSGYACGKCDSCLFRIKGFKEAGIKDPTKYVNSQFAIRNFNERIYL
jgi:7-cyano-7-deazaguanine synthase